MPLEGLWPLMIWKLCFRLKRRRLRSLQRWHHGMPLRPQILALRLQRHQASDGVAGNDALDGAHPPADFGPSGMDPWQGWDASQLVSAENQDPLLAASTPAEAADSGFEPLQHAPSQTGQKTGARWPASHCLWLAVYSYSNFGRAGLHALHAARHVACELFR